MFQLININKSCNGLLNFGVNKKLFFSIIYVLYYFKIRTCNLIVDPMRITTSSDSNQYSLYTVIVWNFITYKFIFVAIKFILGIKVL